MRYLIALTSILFFLHAQAEDSVFSSFEEFNILDFASCNEFNIYAGFYPDLSSFKDDVEAFNRLQIDMHERYGEGFIFYTGVIGGAHAVCSGNYTWQSSPGEKIQFLKCVGDENFPVQSEATFVINRRENPWSARCVSKCGKSKTQRIYWVNTYEGDDSDEEIFKEENLGYARDKKKFEKKCRSK